MTKKRDNEFTKTLRYMGVSKRQLGTELNVSQPTIKDYCENPQKFRLDQLRAISRITDLTVNDLDELIDDKK
tara:strand:+ start:4076 stop:4291 length:216 start_codon:yes stop_codon:yes gene_type:complete